MVDLHFPVFKVPVLNILGQPYQKGTDQHEPQE